MPPKKKTPAVKKEDAKVARIQSYALIAKTIIETFGWPGTLAIASFLFVIVYATRDQKQRIVELYVLGTGIGRLWPMLILSALYVSVALAQHRWYLKKIAAKDAEITRQGDAKSQLQEQLLKKQLPHGRPPQDDKKRN